MQLLVAHHLHIHDMQACERNGKLASGLYYILYKYHYKNKNKERKKETNIQSIVGYA